MLQNHHHQFLNFNFPLLLCPHTFRGANISSLIISKGIKLLSGVSSMDVSSILHTDNRVDIGRHIEVRDGMVIIMPVIKVPGADLSTIRMSEGMGDKNLEVHTMTHVIGLAHQSLGVSHGTSGIVSHQPGPSSLYGAHLVALGGCHQLDSQCGTRET